MPGERFRSAFTVADLISAALPPVTAAVWTWLGAYAVQAGEMVSLGYGSQEGMDNAVGRIYVQIKDDTGTPVVEPGVVRLSIWSAQNRPIEIIGEWRTEILDTSATDRTKQIPFPEHPVWVREDQKIVLEFLSDATDILTKSSCTILMDVTKQIA